MTTAVQLAQSVAPGVSLGFKNRIINGAMMIDQRNAGASVTGSSSANYFAVDRWKYAFTGAGTVTGVRSTTAPAGFVNSLSTTVATTSTPGASDSYQIRQEIEGLNTSDLGFGTSSAQTVSLSFWVRASITGTYAVSLRNSAADRSYVATYSVSSSNTWEYKTLTIVGDTTGTWLTTNGIGVRVTFDLGAGSNWNTTAGAWQAGNYTRTSGCVSLISNSAATFYITGVQLEVGTAATSFEFRDYGRELIMCQRYYETNAPAGTAPSNSVAYLARYLTTAYNTSSPSGLVQYTVSKRAAPSITLYGGSINPGSLWSCYIGGLWLTMTVTTIGAVNTFGFEVELQRSGAVSTGASYITQGGWAASAEL